MHLMSAAAKEDSVRRKGERRGKRGGKKGKDAHTGSSPFLGEKDLSSRDDDVRGKIKGKAYVVSPCPAA